MVSDDRGISAWLEFRRTALAGPSEAGLAARKSCSSFFSWLLGLVTEGLSSPKRQAFLLAAGLLSKLFSSRPKYPTLKLTLELFRARYVRSACRDVGARARCVLSRSDCPLLGGNHFSSCARAGGSLLLDQAGGVRTINSVLGK